MTRKPTIYDVAERAGVSKSLVSLVLRGSPQVSEERRELVQRAMDELNYTPSSLAAGLAGTRTRNIGVVIDEFDNLWFVPALRGLREALRDAGYSLSIADRELNEHLELDPVDVFRSLRVDGLVLAGEVSTRVASRLSIPAVVLGTRSVRLDGIPVVRSDEYAGGSLATAHLYDLGHRDVLCVSAPGASAGARADGYIAEARRRGMEPRVLHAGQTSELEARRALATALAGNAAAAPEAVFAVNDPMAVGVIGALRDLGLRVPEDVSVVGYDNSPLSEYEVTSLTTVDGDPAMLGKTAGQLLVSLIANPRAPAELEATEMLPSLVRRGSSAAPRIGQNQPAKE